MSDWTYFLVVLIAAYIGFLFGRIYETSNLIDKEKSEESLNKDD